MYTPTYVRNILTHTHTHTLTHTHTHSHTHTYTHTHTHTHTQPHNNKNNTTPHTPTHTHTHTHAHTHTHTHTHGPSHSVQQQHQFLSFLFENNNKDPLKSNRKISFFSDNFEQAIYGIIILQIDILMVGPFNQKELIAVITKCKRCSGE